MNPHKRKKLAALEAEEASKREALAQAEAEEKRKLLESIKEAERLG